MNPVEYLKHLWKIPKQIEGVYLNIENEPLEGPKNSNISLTPTHLNQKQRFTYHTLFDPKHLKETTELKVFSSVSKTKKKKIKSFGIHNTDVLQTFFSL